MPTSTPENAKSAIRAKALELGFDAVRFAPAAAPKSLGDQLKSFLDQGRHGDMAWLERNWELRASPTALWTEAQTIVLLGANYGPAEEARGRPDATCGAISVYAQGDDYHEVVKGKLKLLGNFIATRFGADVKVFVDTAPVMEKPLAQAAGLGWQGKHTNLVSREFGSWLFLGSVFTTLEVPADAPETDHCGECRRCLNACPTAAFTAPYRIDARRCISYLTIEHKGQIAEEFRTAIGNRIYGCDDCLAVCPWNKFAITACEARFHARAELKQPPLSELARLDDAAFRSLFRGSPIKRTGRDRFVRNVLIAIGNSGDETLAQEAERLLDDASPLVRAMAVWALKKLIAPEAFDKLRQTRSNGEADSAVRREWERDERLAA
jgi:epoxyqueuosine reductase